MMQFIALFAIICYAVDIFDTREDYEAFLRQFLHGKQVILTTNE